MFGDDHYAQIEPLADTMHVFERVIGSIRQLPERGPDLDPDMGMLTSWVD